MLSRVTWRKIAKFPLKHTCGKCGNRGHMEVCCHTKQDKQGKGRGDSIRREKFGRRGGGVRKIGEQPEQSYEEGSNASEDDGYYVFIASDSESNTLPLMIENELVDVIIDSGATCTGRKNGFTTTAKSMQI